MTPSERKNNFEKEIKDIQTLNIEEVQELRDYYLKTATLFSSRSKIDTAHIYYASTKECTKNDSEIIIVDVNKFNKRRKRNNEDRTNV